jgi:hypothetical protein
MPPRWLERVGGFQLPDPVTANSTAGVGFIVQSERHCQACLKNLDRGGPWRNAAFDLRRTESQRLVRGSFRVKPELETGVSVG